MFCVVTVCLDLLTYLSASLLNYLFVSQTFHLVSQGPRDLSFMVVLLSDLLPLASTGLCFLSRESFELFKTSSQIYFAHQLFLCKIMLQSSVYLSKSPLNLHFGLSILTSLPVHCFALKILKYFL